MPRYSVSKTFMWKGRISNKDAAVMRMFGLTADRLTKTGVTVDCQLKINEGDVVYITGPSGAGKSLLLWELERSIPAPDKVNLGEIKLPADKSVIDCVDGELLQALKVLSTAGLNDVFCVLNRPINLSDGQKYRFRLAMAMASGKKNIFADEFCSHLDRITAAAISYNIRRHAKRTGVTFILAGSHEDMLVDLAPDVLVVKDLSGTTQVIYKSGKI